MIFIDTTAWVGDADANDDFHDSSHRMIESVRVGKAQHGLVTDFVVDEIVTILGKRKGFGASHAKEVAEAILDSPRVFTVFVDEGLMKDALLAYPRYAGKLSFTDVVSTIVMKGYAVSDIFSHDSDFDAVKGIRRITSL